MGSPYANSVQLSSVNPFGDASTYLDGDGNQVVISSAINTAEQDKTSKYAAIFQGISGVITTAADVYGRLKYNAQPGNEHKKKPQALLNKPGSGTLPFSSASLLPNFRDPMTLLVTGVFIVVMIAAFRNK